MVTLVLLIILWYGIGIPVTVVDVCKRCRHMDCTACGACARTAAGERGAGAKSAAGARGPRAHSARAPARASREGDPPFSRDFVFGTNVHGHDQESQFGTIVIHHIHFHVFPIVRGPNEIA